MAKWTWYMEMHEPENSSILVAYVWNFFASLKITLALTELRMSKRKI